jgi:hypothetical protein
MKRLQKLPIILAACLIWLMPLTCFSEMLPPKIQLALLAKILSFDKNIDKNVSNGFLNVAVVFDDKKNNELAKGLSSELEQIKDGKVKVKDYNIKYKLIQLTEATDIEKEIKANNIGIIFAYCLKDNVPQIIKASVQLKVLTVTGDNSLENVKSGISIGLWFENNKPVILLNVNSVMKEGRDFVPQFLSLVKIIKE